MEITFNQLPDAVARLHEKIDRIERLLLGISRELNPQPETDQILTVRETANLLNLSVSTVYGLVNQRKVPVYKGGKRLYFSKRELLDWIKLGRKQTVAEIESEAEGHISRLLLNERRAA